MEYTNHIEHSTWKFCMDFGTRNHNKSCDEDEIIVVVWWWKKKNTIIYKYEELSSSVVIESIIPILYYHWLILIDRITNNTFWYFFVQIFNRLLPPNPITFDTSKESVRSLNNFYKMFLTEEEGMMNGVEKNIFLYLYAIL